jgi:23S rRNA pseudouridine2457 synthase
MAKIIAFNKPFGVICQFSGEGDTLANYIDIPNIYPAGRLDKDSEGLVILTDDGKLQNNISNPINCKTKTYIVQVEGEITEDAINALKIGVVLKDGLTKPALIKKMKKPEWLWDRKPPIRKRRYIPTSWVEISITEGRNRQVRRMTASVGFPTLRLIRIQIHQWKLENIKVGSYVSF